MRILLVIIIGIHGLIHLLGFLKAFQLVELKNFALTISKQFGSLSLIAFILLGITGIMFVLKNNYWWLFGFIAVVISQVFIFFFWKDAKFGTIPNSVILLVSITAFAHFRFNHMVQTEVSEMLSKTDVKQEIVSDAIIGGLPQPVQKWLQRSGIIGHQMIKNVHLKQELQMKMKPGQKKWYNAKAEQYFTTYPHAFNWSVEMNMNPIITFVGRDKFENGKGEMLIKVLSLFPVVNAKENEKINQGSLQRYLAEIVWFPTAALSKTITWESIDDHSAKATISYNGTTGSGTFYFNESGDFKKFSAMRYRGVEDESELNEWIVEAQKLGVINNVKIPVELKATWRSKGSSWTWLKIKLTEINYTF